jgi:DNA-binding CsgD family transcriptional regulator
MATLHARLAELVDCVYFGGDTQAMLCDVFEKLHALIPHDSGIFMAVDPATFQLSVGYAWNCEVKDARDYVAHYYMFDPFVLDSAGKINVNTTMQLSALPSFRQALRSEFAEFLDRVPYRHGLGTPLGFNGHPLAVIGLNRSASHKDFSQKQVQLMQWFAKHLAQALFLRQRVNGVWKPASGMLLVDAMARPLFASGNGFEMLDAQREPYALSTWTDNKQVHTSSGTYVVRTVALPPGSLLAPLVAATGMERRMPANLRRDATDARLFVFEELSNERAGSMTSIDAQREHLRQKQLSKREVDIVLEVVDGATDAEIAKKLRIGTETVKTHLRRIRQKTKLSRRSEFGKLLRQ